MFRTRICRQPLLLILLNLTFSYRGDNLHPMSCWVIQQVWRYLRSHSSHRPLSILKISKKPCFQDSCFPCRHYKSWPLTRLFFLQAQALFHFVLRALLERLPPSLVCRSCKIKTSLRPRSIQLWTYCMLLRITFSVSPPPFKLIRDSQLSPSVLTANRPVGMHPLFCRDVFRIAINWSRDSKCAFYEMHHAASRVLCVNSKHSNRYVQW